MMRGNIEGQLDEASWSGERRDFSGALKALALSVSDAPEVLI